MTLASGIDRLLLRAGTRYDTRSTAKSSTVTDERGPTNGILLPALPIVVNVTLVPCTVYSQLLRLQT